MMFLIYKKIRRYVGGLYTAVCVISGAVSAADNSPQMQLFSEINHPFVYYKPGTEEPTGIAYDIVQEVFREAGITPKVTILPWKRSERLYHETLDSCLFTMNKIPEREHQYIWIAPLVLGGLALFKDPTADIDFREPVDIAKTIVIGRRGGVALKVLRENHKFEALEAPTDEVSARLLYVGRGDLWAAGVIDAPITAKALGLPTPEMVYQYRDANLGMGCRLDTDPALILRLKQAFSRTKEVRADILAKYQ